MTDTPDSETPDALIGIAKSLKMIAQQQEIIAKQQKRQTESLRNLSAISTFLLVTVVLMLLIMAARGGIFF